MSRKKLAAEQTVTKLRQIEVSLAQGKKTAIACKEVDPTDQSNRLKRDLVLQALDRALALRNPPPDCIHHTDRGSQYCSHDYQRRLQQLGFNVSMSGKGNCYDNAAVETFFKTIKAELICGAFGRPVSKSHKPSFNTSTASTTSAADIQQQEAYHLLHSNDKPPKREPNAELIGDKSTAAVQIARFSPEISWPSCRHLQHIQRPTPSDQPQHTP